MSGPLRGSFLAVRVTPKASRNEVTGLYTAAEGSVSLAVKVTAAADKGKANAAVTSMLAQKLGVAKSMLTLVKDETDRNKSFQFTGPLEPLEALIASLTNTGKKDGEDH